MQTAIVTGASRGLGLALGRALVERGWRLVVDARGGAALAREWNNVPGVTALAGDVRDPAHRRSLVEAAGDEIHLLVNNASLLGPSPQAALEQVTAILAAEHPTLRVYAVDPGDMRTQMHQEAFPGEDISDRPPPEESVPGLLALIEGDIASGRYRAADLALASGCRGRMAGARRYSRRSRAGGGGGSRRSSSPSRWRITCATTAT